MPKKSKKTNNNGVKSSKKKKLSNKQIPPRIKLPPNSYLISITQPEDRRKGNGGCKPKDPVWDNYHILLVNLNSPPKNANIRACICKYCKKLIRKQKYPIKVSTLRCHGLQCQKTPAERKNLIIASNEKLKIKNALWTLHKTRNHKKLPTRRIYAHPSEAIEPVTYANIISNIERKENENNNIFEINNIEDYYHFHIRNNSGRICIGSGANINNTNNPSSIHGDIQHLIEQSAETSNALESMKTEINKVFSSYNNMDDIDMIHNQQQQPSINRSLPSTLPIPTLSTEPNAIPTLELEILPSLETRFPNAFANAEEKEEPLSIKEEPTTEPLFNPTFNPTRWHPTFNPTSNIPSKSPTALSLSTTPTKAPSKSPIINIKTDEQSQIDVVVVKGSLLFYIILIVGICAGLISILSIGYMIVSKLCERTQKPGAASWPQTFKQLSCMEKLSLLIEAVDMITDFFFSGDLIANHGNTSNVVILGWISLLSGIAGFLGFIVKMHMMRKLIGWQVPNLIKDLRRPSITNSKQQKAINKMRQCRIDIDVITLLMACLEDCPQTVIVILIVSSSIGWSSISLANVTVSVISFCMKLLQIVLTKYGCKDPDDIIRYTSTVIRNADENDMDDSENQKEMEEKSDIGTNENIMLEMAEKIDNQN
eukprot:467882_1